MRNWLRRLFRKDGRPAARRRLPESLDPRAFAPVPDGGWLVGGAVRDALLGREQADMDWLVAQPERTASLAASLVEGAYFALDERRGHWRVVTGSTIRDYIRLDGSLEQNLLQRDFTINSLAMGGDGRIIDVADGLADLQAGLLRMNGEQVLRADPVRLLRGVRLAAQLGFEFHPGTLDAMRRLAREQQEGVLSLPAWERVRVELDSIVTSERAAAGFRLLADLGLLDVYLPELTAGRGVFQGGFHHLDVMDHQIEALAALLQSFPEADLSLRWATLLHDVGKPGTVERPEEGPARFHGHDRLGGELARNAMARLRQPTARQERVAELVRRHMLQLPRDERGARRLTHRYRHLLPDLLKLMIADREAARGRLSSENTRKGYRLALAQILAIMNEPPPQRPLLSGHELMELLGIESGPRVGEAARYLAELQAVGDAGTVEEAAGHLRAYARAQGWFGEDAD